jgi:hypothetical protein
MFDAIWLRFVARGEPAYPPVLEVEKSQDAMGGLTDQFLRLQRSKD